MVALPLILASFISAPPVVIIDRDNVEITQDCTVQVGRSPIIDADGDGVVHITADGIAVDFASQRLHGAPAEATADAFEGIGVRVTSKNVTLRGARVSGYRVGIHALQADGLVLADCDVSGNFRQRLKSTPQAEDEADWLWPHENDQREWMTRYGAGVCIERSAGVTVRNVKARDGQNGIMLDRVEGSRVYDCDCSFLSGWGLAMWRSSRNVISRNAFDFCIRGYSHGVYNRGQDSAGILMFEQCCENLIAENSATHCGDGLFAFAGRSALGEKPSEQPAEPDWFKRRGDNDNTIFNNDFSFAAAHGLELTFSHGNTIYRNRLVGNAICGIWGGYSQFTHIAGNYIAENGDMAYGLERGGINIEHGRGNRIDHNRFERNACGVHLWTDDDPNIFQTPWYRANSHARQPTVISENDFKGDALAIQLRGQRNVVVALNSMEDVAEPVRADGESAYESATMMPTRFTTDRYEFPGENRPFGARKSLAGREHIVMTPWGPYDWQAPLLLRTNDAGHEHIYRVLGTGAALDEPSIAVDGAVEASVNGDRLVIRTRHPGEVTAYSFHANCGSDRLTCSGVLAAGTWDVAMFPSVIDPRQDEARWREQGMAQASTVSLPTLALRYGHGGPSELNLSPQVSAAHLPHDHFGTIARMQLTFPPGRWRITTISDDGIRVWLDEKLVIDDWTWHAPKRHTHEFALDQRREVNIRVEHFELDGYAILTLNIDGAE